jgi:hypothetical protein
VTCICDVGQNYPLPATQKSALGERVRIRTRHAKLSIVDVLSIWRSRPQA